MNWCNATFQNRVPDKDATVVERLRNAGAVLIATVNAIAIGYLVFSGQIADRSARLLDQLRDAPAQLTLIALVLTIIVVIATKAYPGRGTPLRGGLPSGHAAVAFAGWMAATYIINDSHRFLISSLTFIMALLVAQTRVESGVHSALEVAYGGVLGAARERDTVTLRLTLPLGGQ